jgi:hypothetical protein
MFEESTNIAAISEETTSSSNEADLSEIDIILGCCGVGIRQYYVAAKHHQNDSTVRNATSRRIEYIGLYRETLPFSALRPHTALLKPPSIFYPRMSLVLRSSAQSIEGEETVLLGDTLLHGKHKSLRSLLSPAAFLPYRLFP